ncbi:MAG: HNH endonuclease [Vicinamibacterales bacterium]|nr:HNH endonuclease [Vicinamibacterales bacterium]
MKHHHLRRLCTVGQDLRNSAPRSTLTASERKEVLVKTDGNCHVCGGRAGKAWQADHVIPHRLGGAHSMDNYLAICRTCNVTRRSHAPEVQRVIMRLGTYARAEINRKTDLGEELVQLFLRRDQGNRARRKKPK